MTNPVSDSASSPSPARRTAASSLGGRLWKGSMGLFLAMVGGLFCWYLWASWQKGKAMDDWVATPARIIASEAVEWRFNEISRLEFQAEVRYEYEYEGAKYISERIRRWPVRSSDPEEIQEWVSQYPNGSEVTAYVNPREPDFAVLKKNSKAAIYSIWFPLLFVVGGLGMFITALLPNRK